MAGSSEFGQRIKAYSQIGGGLVVEGVGVQANSTYLTAIPNEAIKVADSIGGGNLPDIATVIAHVPFDLWNTLVHAGPVGIAAGIAIGFGLWLVGKGAINHHELSGRR